MGGFAISAPKNESLDALYSAVGEAISNWAAVENELHQIFCIANQLVAMQPGGGFSYEATIPSSVLDAIDGFNAKLLMIDAALEAALFELDEEAQALLNEWAQIHRKKVRALHRNRSQLAHWTAVVHTNLETGKRRPVLAPPNYSSSEHQGIVETDIKEWAANFIEANQRLAEFVDRLASHRGLQRKHLALVASQVLCTLPSDPTLLEFLRQQLSGHL